MKKGEEGVGKQGVRSMWAQEGNKGLERGKTQGDHEKINEALKGGSLFSTQLRKVGGGSGMVLVNMGTLSRGCSGALK